MVGVCSIRKMTPQDLELVFGWRNHPSIRRNMYRQHEIVMDEHQRWFEEADTDRDRELLIFELNGVPSGYVGLRRVGPGGIADWGFYTAPGTNKGTGKLLGQTVLDYAFQRLGLHKLCGQVLAYNEASISFHLRLGFVHEGTLRQQHFDGSTYHDVLCFGLLSGELKH